jgi:hypothetical protein
MAWCGECGDEFAPVEYVTVPQDPDELIFCSSECESLNASVTAYEEGRFSAAPVY